MNHCFWWTLVLFLVVFCLLSTSTTLFTCKCGNVTSSLQYVFLNESFEITCKLEADYIATNQVDSSSLYFKHDGKVIPSETIVILDNQTISLKTSLSEPHLGEYKYTCFLKGTIENPQDQLVEGVTIFADYPVKGNSVTEENFHAMWLNWSEVLVTNWKFTYPHKYLENLDVTLYKKYSTSCKSLDKISCNFTDATLTMAQAYFRLVVGYIPRPEIQQKYYFSRLRSENLKPSPVESMSASNASRNSTACLMLQWKYLDFSEMTSRHFRIIYFQTSAHDNMFQVNQTLPNVTSYDLCGLDFFSEYSVTIQAQSTDGGFYSDKLTKIFQTDESVPSYPPTTIEGGYTWNWKRCKINQRSAKIFYIPTPRNKINSIFTGIRVTVKKTDEEIKQDQSISQNAKSLDVMVPCNTSVIVELQTVNKKGASVEAASIAIAEETYEQAASLILPVISVAYDSNFTNTYNVSWPPSNDNISQYTFFFCPEKYIMCQEKFQWQVVPATQNWVSVSLPNTEMYQFALSSVKNGMGTSLLFVNCIYPEVPVPRNVTAIPKGSDQVYVRWPKIDCHEYQESVAYIKEYEVKICHLENHGPGCGKHEFKRTSDSSVLISNLQANQQYGIQVKAISKYNVSAGPYSSLVVVTTEEKWENINKNFKTVLGVTLAVSVAVIMIAVVVIIRHKRNRKGQKFSVEIPPPLTPDPNVSLPGTQVPDNAGRELSLSTQGSSLTSSCHYASQDSPNTSATQFHHYFVMGKSSSGNDTISNSSVEGSHSQSNQRKNDKSVEDSLKAKFSPCVMVTKIIPDQDRDTRKSIDGQIPQEGENIMDNISLEENKLKIYTRRNGSNEFSENSYLDSNIDTFSDFNYEP